MDNDFMIFLGLLLLVFLVVGLRVLYLFLKDLFKSLSLYLTGGQDYRKEVRSRRKEARRQEKEARRRRKEKKLRKELCEGHSSLREWEEDEKRQREDKGRRESRGDENFRMHRWVGYPPEGPKRSDELWPGEYNNRFSSNMYPSDWEWRKHYVRERDKCTCQYCGSIPPLLWLHAHHRTRDSSEARQGIHHVDNLVCLCIECHAKQAGQRHRNLHEHEDFERFISWKRREGEKEELKKLERKERWKDLEEELEKLERKYGRSVTDLEEELESPSDTFTDEKLKRKMEELEQELEQDIEERWKDLEEELKESSFA